MTCVLEGPEDLREAVGDHLGWSDWLEVKAGEVDLFAMAAPDPTAPLGTIPPMMVLALTNLFLPEIVQVEGFSTGVNYGTGPVRFGPPMPIGNRLRGGAELLAVDDVRGWRADHHANHRPGRRRRPTRLPGRQPQPLPAVVTPGASAPGQISWATGPRGSASRRSRCRAGGRPGCR